VCFVVEGVTNDLLGFGFGYGFLGYICFIGMLWLGNRGIGREWVQIDEKQWCLRWCCYSHCLCQFGECGVLKNMFIMSINVSAKLMMKRAIKPIHPFCQHSALMSSSFWRYHHLLFFFVFFFIFSISARQKATYKGTEFQKPNMGLEVCPPPFTFLQSPSCLGSGTSLYHFPNVNLFNSLYIYIFRRPTFLACLYIYT
jgi:hypothetical protein